MDSDFIKIISELNDLAEETFNNEKSRIERQLSGLDYSKAFEFLMSTLWYSRLPCFDVTGVTSFVRHGKDILKYCTWKGQVSISPTFYEQLFVGKCFSHLLCAYSLGLSFFDARKLAQKLLIKCW